MIGDHIRRSLNSFETIQSVGMRLSTGFIHQKDYQHSGNGYVHNVQPSQFVYSSQWITTSTLEFGVV